MHYRYAGEGGEAAIFLHMSGSTSEEYETVGDLLAERGFCVYAVDLLGFGSSDKPAHYYYCMDEHIATILAFMDALGIKSAYLYGNMATANMAARMSIYHPERVKGIMLAHPLYNPDPDYFKRRGHTTGFCKIDLAEDGSHLMEMWARATKYGDPMEISDQRCAALHNAGEWGETLHWALHDDTPFCKYLEVLRAKTVVVAYSFFGDPTPLKNATKKIVNGVFDFYENATPYISRRAPQVVADMFCKHFPGK